MTLLVLALLAALAAVGAWEYTNGNFYALPEQLHTLLTEHVRRPGRHWYKNDPLCHAAARRNTASGMAQQ